MQLDIISYIYLSQLKNWLTITKSVSSSIYELKSISMYILTFSNIIHYILNLHDIALLTDT